MSFIISTLFLTDAERTRAITDLSFVRLDVDLVILPFLYRYFNSDLMPL